MKRVETLTSSVTGKNYIKHINVFGFTNVMPSIKTTNKRTLWPELILINLQHNFLPWLSPSHAGAAHGVTLKPTVCKPLTSLRLLKGVFPLRPTGCDPKTFISTRGSEIVILKSSKSNFLGVSKDGHQRFLLTQMPFLPPRDEVYSLPHEFGLALLFVLTIECGRIDTVPVRGLALGGLASFAFSLRTHPPRC